LQVKWRVIPGDTILFDFIFFTHPTAIGHWWVAYQLLEQHHCAPKQPVNPPCLAFTPVAVELEQTHVHSLHVHLLLLMRLLCAWMSHTFRWEMLGPMYSSLKVAGFKRPCDQFILLHLQVGGQAWSVACRLSMCSPGALHAVLQRWLKVSKLLKVSPSAYTMLEDSMRLIGTL
jgi:hypothetical protein